MLAYTIAQLRLLFGLSNSGIYKAIRLGHGPVLQKVPGKRKRLITAEDAIAWGLKQYRHYASETMLGRHAARYLAGVGRIKLQQWAEQQRGPFPIGG